MMLKSKPVSAFAVYSMKRKITEPPHNAKKLKKKHVHKKHSVSSNQQSMHKNSQKTIKLSVNKSKNVSIKNTVVPKKIQAPSISTTRKKRMIKKPAHTTKAKVVVKSNADKMKTKKKLKSSTLTVNTGVAKVKQIRQKQWKQQLKNIETQTAGKHTDSKWNRTVENHESPITSSRLMFDWLIHPMKAEDFFAKNWEKSPLYIKRHCPNYYKVLMSTPMLDKILREHYILFTKNIDITSYENGVRETHNPLGRALPTVVWDYYMNGCSVRMLNPQTYIPKLHALNATLQEFFGCFVGSNSYLTPPNSQGFAPHYDDIEAFILQIEGQKRWRLYKPPTENEYLPRYSSKNFSQSEIGEPILDTIVNAGDLLYFPRGTIHQGETIDDKHSLHITISVYQKNSWGDYLEKLLPDALATAIESDSTFRLGLPLDYLTYTGYVYSNIQNRTKDKFKNKIKDLFSKLIDYIDIDKAADLMAMRHIHDFLPPVFSEIEEDCSAREDGERMTRNGIVTNRVEIEPDTRIRLSRSHCIRLVKGENKTFEIYYSTENSKEYHEYDLQYLDVNEEFVPAVREIILQYPNYIRVEDLPIDGIDNKIQITKDLWEKCLVVTEEPLNDITF